MAVMRVPQVFFKKPLCHECGMLADPVCLMSTPQGDIQLCGYCRDQIDLVLEDISNRLVPSKSHNELDRVYNILTDVLRKQ
jgi:hypothetical protein